VPKERNTWTANDQNKHLDFGVEWVLVRQPPEALLLLLGRALGRRQLAQGVLSARRQEWKEVRDR
jgi:hypothetical protein